MNKEDLKNGKARRLSFGKKIATVAAATIGSFLIGSAVGFLLITGHYDHWGTAVSRFSTGYWVSPSAAVEDGVVYVGSVDDHLYAVDALTGQEKWRFRTGSWVLSSPSVVDNIVYVGSVDNNLYAVDAQTGEMKWRFNTRDAIFSSPTVADGVVYIGSDDD